MDINLLKKLGFSDKSAKLYLILLGLGPSSVRKLAESTGLNRGTIYEILKDLQDRQIVRYYKEDTKQLFVAEDPDKLRDLLFRQEKELKEVESNLSKLLPELQALYNPGGQRPIAKYYTHDEIRLILEDVLLTCENVVDSEYLVYSTEGLREELYNDFPTFSDVRIAKGIKVRVIAIGKGGELRGLDERKWLDGKNQTPTYIIIYSGKTAYISLDAKKELVGVVIENDGIYQTQKMIFNNLWNRL
ncbi:MAG TPA: transcriptional regulator [Candidatus Magasanikbacteria bacterium]|nr:transcriptional regulator [Candidatus Magasanikbacteria bacterium]